MRRTVRIASIAALFYLAACAGDTGQNPVTPGEGPVGRPALAPAQVPNPYCSPVTAEEVEAQISALFFKNAWPDANSALGKFGNVQSQLPGDVTGAQFSARDLVRFIANKFDHLTAAQQAASQADYDQLVTNIYCYVGISGQVFDLNPGDPEKAFSIPGVGGVYFPANVVPTGTMVSLTDISALPSPLITDLDTYAGYISIELIPAGTLIQLATVVLCPTPDAPPDVVVGHQDPTVGFELLDPAPVPTLLANTCTVTASQRVPTTWFDRLLAHATNAMLPAKLEASAMFFAGGIGGTTLRFSPFGVTSTSGTGTGGLGGTTLRFAPPVNPAAASPSGPQASNPALPPTFVDGTAGTTVTTNLPFVTIMTPGGDVDGSNPISDVSVNFTIGAAQTYDPDSQAQVCDATGAVPASGVVSVTTDANGVAMLPCLKFGNLAGFANLSATFDPTTLGFPNADLVTITAVDGTLTGTSLNWLVRTNAAAAATIQTYFPPAAPAQSFNYGTNLPVNTTVSPAPQVIVQDAFGNVVASQAVHWNATTSNGSVLTVGSGSTTDASGTAQVTSWTIEDGFNEATASLYDANTVPPAGFLPALFTATTPTGLSVFACSLGSSKTDLAPFSIKTPNSNVRSVTLWMSVTGQSSSLSAYPATIKVYKGGATGPQVGQGGGTIQLPGDNGNPVPQTFVLTDPVLKTESQGSSVLWFQLTVTAPSNRKVQLWYKSGTFRNNDPCNESKVYTPTYPTNTTFKRGLSINATN